MDRIKLFESIFDNALEIYITHDKQCKVVYANKNAERLLSSEKFSIFSPSFQRVIFSDSLVIR